jgi:hypothetical protein
MSYYQPLTRFLEGRRESEVKLTFPELEKILNRRLPDSARKHQAWWANTTSHSHADAWLRLDWKTAGVDLAGERVVFVRADHPASSAGSPAAGRSGSGPDSVVVNLSRFGPAARRLVHDYAAEMTGDTAGAIARAVHEAAIARRGRLIDSIAANAPRVPIGQPDSVELIREDRDAR